MGKREERREGGRERGEREKEREREGERDMGEIVSAFLYLTSRISLGHPEILTAQLLEYWD